MILAGKAPPEKDELRDVEERGFENVELYLEKKHLDSFEESIRNTRESKLNVVSIHTPHLPISDKNYFLKADSMAVELDAFLVFHSGQISLQKVPTIESWNLESEHGYEGHSGISAEGLRNLVIDRGCNAVADIAHLYIGEDDILSSFSNLLEENAVKVLHLCDSTKQKDGLGFGKGSVPVEEACRAVKDSGYDGIVVLEVMPEDQADALEKWREYAS